MKKQFKLSYISFCDRSNEFKSIESVFKSMYLDFTAGQKRFIDKIFADIDSCSKIFDKDMAKQSISVIIYESVSIPELDLNFDNNDFKKAFDVFWNDFTLQQNISHHINLNYILYIQFVALLSILFFNLIIIKNSIAILPYCLGKTIFLLITTLLLSLVAIAVAKHIIKNM